MEMGNFKLIVENGLLNHDTARQLYGFAAWAYRRTGKDKEISLDLTKIVKNILFAHKREQKILTISRGYIIMQIINIYEENGVKNNANRY